MQKKRSVGIAVIGIFHMLGIFPLLTLLKKFGEGLLILDVTFCIFLFLVACGTLFLKNIARVSLIFTDVALLIALLPGIFLAVKYIVDYNFMLRAFFLFLLTSMFPIVFLITSIFYLTRPKVKEQFK